MSKPLFDYSAIYSRLIHDWPPGVKVWHRANAKRGLVVAWQVAHTGSAFVVVDWGNSSGCEYALALSRAPVHEGGDGEEWKEGAH